MYHFWRSTNPLFKETKQDMNSWNRNHSPQISWPQLPKVWTGEANVYNLLGLYPHWQNDYWVGCSTWVTTSKTALLNFVVTAANWLLRCQIQLTTGAVWGKKQKAKKKRNKNKGILKRQRKSNELRGAAKYRQFQNTEIGTLELEDLCSCLSSAT